MVCAAVLLVCAMIVGYSDIELALVRPILLTGVAGEVPADRAHYVSS